MDLIVIPSMGRAKQQRTLACFERTGLTESYKVLLAVPEDETKAYLRASCKGKRIKNRTMEGLTAIPKEYSGISRTREYILTKLAKQYKATNVLMVDDDLRFCTRPDIDNAYMPYIDSKPYEMHLMVETLTEWLEKGFVHVGLISRQANRKTGVKYQEPGRLMNIYAYNSKVIRTLVNQQLLKLGRVPVMEDFDLTLQLLRLGYSNRVSCQFAWTQTSNTDGGCSSYRTAEVQASAARQLAQLHKPFVTLVKSKLAKTWQNELTERVDVRVRWMKALQSGLQSEQRKAA